MQFTKMHGIGNDYVYVDGTETRPADAPACAVKVSDRHFGIGSDGLILINSSDCADFEMEMYNLDGSLGNMCGNGIRCVAKYVYDHGMTDKTELKINTPSGVREIQLNVGEDGRVSTVRVDMGVPELVPEKIPVKLPGDRAVAVPYEIDGRSWELTCIGTGNPHCVVFPEEKVEDLALDQVGPLFENDRLFPDRVNTEFINVLSRTHLRMRVWERGSGETMACGTGACASACAAILRGYADNKVTVTLNGGDLEIEWNGQADGHIYMTGPAEEVFRGEIDGIEMVSV